MRTDTYCPVNAGTDGIYQRRNLDPQLHTHAVIANMTLGADGR